MPTGTNIPAGTECCDLSDGACACYTGAAFGEGLAVGLSTTVAVFCHELPHELGLSL